MLVHHCVHIEHLSKRKRSEERYINKAKNCFCALLMRKFIILIFIKKGEGGVPFSE